MTLSLDPGRSDLLVEAELARFADLFCRHTPSETTERDRSAGSFWSHQLRCGEV